MACFLYFILGIILGNIGGIFLMCLLQINKEYVCSESIKRNNKSG